MEKKLSELVFILDKSGSMSGLEEDTIGSFNSTIKSHLDSEYDVLVTTVLFSDDDYILHDRVNIKEIKLMSEKDYRVGGCTALIDAMGNTIKHIKNIHKYQREEDIPDHTMFVIMTDGYENASHVYSSDEVKKMIEQQKEVGWEFVFLAANIDAVETAKSFSISESRAVNYINDRKGIKKAHDFVANYSKASFASSKSCCLSDEDVYLMRNDVDEDYIKRNKTKEAVKVKDIVETIGPEGKKVFEARNKKLY